jgi:hypothetical protein
MVILDACRNNPFERRFRATVSGGLAQIDAPTGTLLAYATAPGKVASDGNGSNGLYTEALLKALDMPGLKVEDVFKQVRINVVKSSDSQQTPWESSSLTGEFYFTPGARPAIADEKLKQSEKERADLAKALDEERRKRDKDAELVRVEMEKLRAELQKIRADAGVPVTPAVVAAVKTIPATKPEPNTPPQKPAEAAIAIPSSSPTSLPTPPTSMSAVPDLPSITSTQQPQQVATIAPSPSMPIAITDDWARRIALLEKLRGQLTFAKAIALLFDITSTNDLIKTALLEKLLQEAGWANALAIGIDGRGKAAWAGAAKFRNSTFASESAIESCSNKSGTRCKVVLLNGSFQEHNFIEWAQRLTESDTNQWRESFLESMLLSPNESISAGGASNVSLGNPSASARIFTPVKQ